MVRRMSVNYDVSTQCRKLPAVLRFHIRKPIITFVSIYEYISNKGNQLRSPFLESRQLCFGQLREPKKTQRGPAIRRYFSLPSLCLELPNYLLSISTAWFAALAGADGA